MPYSLASVGPAILPEGLTHDEVEKATYPKTVWEAIISLRDNDPKEWDWIAEEVFKLDSPDKLKPEAILGQVQKVDTCEMHKDYWKVWVGEDGWRFIVVNK